ncbi:hypothetical protein HMPREF1553_01903 [Porphyromonas gingivalis F0568]|nr:hypothetical protein HMPREF1553_01903 [Porphyromonas gingivalis F0568]
MCTLRIEGRSNAVEFHFFSFLVVCTLRIEGRSNRSKRLKKNK